MAKSDGCDYFRRTSLFWIVSVTLGMGYYTCTVFVPEKIPFEELGPFGSFCRYLVVNHADIMYKGWWAAWAVHLFEACFALKVCSNKGIDNVASRCLWFVQTFLFGFASLGLLIKYDPKRPKQH
ncbi:transmembrane protein 254 [Micropterus salmoides]|uniref:transmembrane protein 254 n=1 Tax=Micropterus salmoides TaxID=27706 RepID=UPI0018EA8217|nr:transmembrane protein 254 [Micropterus salmoides]XP_045927151.1 transmembrane protein 254 [Micropterus dolomieu]